MSNPTQVVILIPGIMGSTLMLDERQIWPGPVKSLISSYKMMKELMDDRLVAVDVIRNYTAFSEQYTAIISQLKVFGFDERSHPQTLYIFPYDWRRSNIVSARLLADRIDKVVEEHGELVSISLVAHSMGGLICRYYLESGIYTPRIGFSKISQLITLGTPHRGAAIALQRILGQDNVLWLNREQVKQLTNDENFPSAYELLPPLEEQFIWDESANGKFQPMTLDEARTKFFTSEQLSPVGLTSLQNLRAGLDYSKRPVEVRYFAFASAEHKTVSHVRILQQTTTRVRGVEVNWGGDGTVPGWSGVLPGLQSLTVGGEHSVIYKNAMLRRTLGSLLGFSGVRGLEDSGQRFELSIRDHVIESQTQPLLYLSLRIGDSSDEVHGELRIERTRETEVGVDYQTVKKTNIAYKGLSAEVISMTAEAPSDPGTYRAAFYPADHPESPATDEFFVQLP